MTGRTDLGRAPRFHMALLLGVSLLIVACAAGYERTARERLASDGYEEVTMQPLKRGNNAFSFVGSRNGQTCEGEIELQEQMGQTTAAVSSRCGADPASSSGGGDDEEPAE